ncbi:MAG: nuclear transport factor 2 family protein [Roseibium sp.]|uniref:nuclear transport factor 2 family protein n=1 Tax=Roseibium sp. TaxID=1936156 RepID=UPI00261FF4F3|nr:nuclear transport factor 2 family protein [Roseibium sp.]MCV0425397.1 nuclear transport factor 2 family protein [Roseibium sp.]
MTEYNTIPSFGAMLRQALGNAIDADAGDDFLAMCSDDVVFQFPFAPKGAVTEIRGRETLTSYLQAAGAMISFESMKAAVVHPSKDGKTFTLEFSCKASGSKTGRRYDQDYVSVVTVQDGRIVRYRDYWNPLVLLDAVGGVETLKSTFKDFSDV